MEQTIFVAEDDDDMRDALAMLFRSVGRRVEAFKDAAALLDRVRTDPPGCIVSDIRMPAMDGLALQRHLRTAGIRLPMIFVSGYADVALGIAVMRDGAVSLLTKPFREQELLDAVAEALAREQEERTVRDGHAAVAAAYDTLDPREREIMADVANGLRNKTIAARLGLSEITIKIVRARMMRKMGVDSSAQLARLAERLGL